MKNGFADVLELITSKSNKSSHVSIGTTKTKE